MKLWQLQDCLEDEITKYLHELKDNFKSRFYNFIKIIEFHFFVLKNHDLDSSKDDVNMA